MPNLKIILNAVILGEAKESSEIEIIVTTFDEVFKKIYYIASEEVVNYRQAVLYGYKQVKKNNFLNCKLIEEIHQIILISVGCIITIPRAVIMNTKRKEIFHTLPQGENEICNYLSIIEKYINYTGLENIDSLIKMTMILY